MIPLKDQEAIKLRFARDLNNRVRIDFFSQKPSPIYIAGRQECVTCEDVRKLLQELAGLSLRVSVTPHDLDADEDEAAKLGVDRAPGIVLRGPANRPLRFFGLPSGTLFLAFVETIIATAQTQSLVKPETQKLLRRLRSDADLKVFVMPNCPHSPAMALTAARLALAGPRINLQIVVAGEYPQLAQDFLVRATPLTVLDDRYAIPGALDEASLARDILDVAEGKEPSLAGDASKLTPVARPQTQQQQTPRMSPGGLYLPG